MKRTIKIKGKIGEDFTINHLKTALRSATELWIYFDSIGGVADEGLEMANLIKNSTVKTIGILDNKAYSAASVMFVACDVKYVNNGSSLMMHNPYIETINNANADTLYFYAQNIKMIEKEYKDFYLKCLSIDDSKLKELMDNEITLFGNEIVELGIANKYELKAVAKFKPKQTMNFKNLVRELAKALGADDNKPEIDTMIVKSEAGDVTLYIDGESGKAYLDEELSMLITDTKYVNTDDKEVSIDAEGVLTIVENADDSENADVVANTDTDAIDTDKLADVVAKMEEQYSKVAELETKILSMTDTIETLNAKVLESITNNDEIQSMLEEERNKTKKALALLVKAEQVNNGNGDASEDNNDASQHVFDNSINKLRNKK